MTDDAGLTPHFQQTYGPWAVVLGASEGIGAAFARRLVAAGLGVVLVARHTGRLAALAGELEAAGGAVRTAPLDLTDTVRLGPELRRTTEGLEIGLVIYNAGATHGAGALLDEPLDTALRLVRLNCAGPLTAVHIFAPAMRARGRGGIILLGSMAGIAGAARIATYAATKAFDQVLAESLWAELGPSGVHVLGLIAGATDTPALARSTTFAAAMSPMDPDDVAAEGLAHLPDGPTWCAGPANRDAAVFLRSLPRDEAVRLLTSGTDVLYPPNGS